MTSLLSRTAFALVFAWNFAALAESAFRAGAVAVDITPPEFPVIVNGGFLEKQATRAVDPLHARAVVLDDGKVRVAICVVDTCMMTRELIDAAKARASESTGIPMERMLVSATHTHSAPSAMACLGTRLDPKYAAFLPGKIAEAITGAAQRLEPAKVGWAVSPAWDFTNCRRWIRRPDKMITDPFGVVSARANMHPGYQNSDAIGPSGPIDPDLSLLSIQRPDGKPLAVLANFSMHYFGAGPVSADYFGKFAAGIGRAIGAEEGASFVGIMSQGTSGDSQWMDYSQPKRDTTSDEYAAGLVKIAAEACRQIAHRDTAPLAMAEAKLRLGRRVADAERLAWARKIAEPMGDRVPANQQEVYAREQLLIAAEPERELKLQALRIGGLGITAIPNEVYALTGLKLKAQSPLQPTFNIELANGSDGYIPPPEQHRLGGYTTWAARTAGLLPEAEPRIVETLLGLLEQVAGSPRRVVQETHGAYAQAILSAKPMAYWRMNEFVPPTARDTSGHGHDATYDWERGVAFHLLGAGNGLGASSRASLTNTAFSGPERLNRAPHFAGGAMKAELPALGVRSTVTCWLWNGLDPKARTTTGILLSRGSERLGITGKDGDAGRLFFAGSEAGRLVGKTTLLWKDWHHVALVRDGAEVVVYLDGQPEISGNVKAEARGAELFFGGRAADGDTLEGKIDEAAVFDRALTAGEIAAQYRASGPPPRAITAVPESSAVKPAARVAMPVPTFPPEYAAAIQALRPASQPSVRAYAGQRIAAEAPAASPAYSVSLWFRSDLPNEARAVTAYLVSRGPDGNREAPGDHVGIGGSYRAGFEGRLMFYNGNTKAETLLGKSVISPGSWNHAVLVREGRQVTAYLNGRREIAGIAEVTAEEARPLFLGARSDQFAPLQGALAECAVFDRALSEAEVASLFALVKFPPVASADVLAPSVPPLSPAESMRKIHLPPGLKVELMAAEPMVLDPVAFDWDARGRLWVVEMADYPLGMDNQGRPGGRIRILEDSDADGRYERSTLFASGLNFPNGLLTWRDGVIVTAAPQILYLRDTNGDDRADEQEVIVSGLQEGNQQLRANGLRWGLDNWIYVAAGGHHGKYGVETRLRVGRTGEEVRVGSRDFRFRLETGELEPQSGPTQFGRNRDNWGRWFGSQNSNPLWHYVLPDHYLRRNPQVGAAETRVQLLAPANPPVFPASPQEKRFHSFNQAGHFTSGCSGVIVRDRAVLAEGLNALVCEPFHNLVQLARLTDRGVSFTAERVPGEKDFDFFASEDRWCRPVMVREGPDGALWIADMYRYMIEHPQFLPPAGKDELLPHYRAGDELGRIYRVSRVDVGAPKPVRLDRMSGTELVAVLASSSGWQRDKAQQILLWRGERSVSAALREMAERGSSPLARLHALCVLDGLNELSPTTVARALSDDHPGVRENALRLAETRFTPEVLAVARKLAEDPDPKVRLQLAFSLGASGDAAAGETLAHLLKANEAEPMLAAAVTSSATPHLTALARAGGGQFEALFGTALSAGNRDALAELLRPMLTLENGRSSAAQLVAFGGILDRLAAQRTSLEQLRGDSSDALGRVLRDGEALLGHARTIASDVAAAPMERVAAAGVLGRVQGSREEALGHLAAWLEPRHSTEIQGAAIRALSATGAEKVPGILAKMWSAMSPATREAALGAWTSREAWTLDLMQRIEHREIPLSGFGAVLRARLLKHESARVRELAVKVLGNPTGTRAKVVETYRAALTMPTEAERGRAVYLRACAACHRRGAEGQDIGPDLASVVEHPPEKLLTAIFDPNADIQPGFNAYTCTLQGGEQIYGLVAAETANSVTMKLPDASSKTILRTQIVSLQSQNLSLMPEGFEAALSPAEVADLIAFLRQPLR